MHEHTVMYIQKVGPRGGRRWVRSGSITHGAFAITRPGVYKLTRFVNGFATGSRVVTITEDDIARETWAPGKIGPHGLGIELS